MATNQINCYSNCYSKFYSGCQCTYSYFPYFICNDYQNFTSYSSQALLLTYPPSKHRPAVRHNTVTITFFRSQTRMWPSSMYTNQRPHVSRPILKQLSYWAWYYGERLHTDQNQENSKKADMVKFADRIKIKSEKAHTSS